MIPHSRPSVGKQEAEVAARVIRSGALAAGSYTVRFEAEVARQTGAAWGVATNSGTAALHLALLGLGIGPGDRVAIPSYVCVALLHAVRYVGAEPVIVDVDPGTMNMDPDALRRKAPVRLAAVILPHMFGLPAETDAVLSLGAPVIEDCAHAIGAATGRRPVGGMGRIGICSFYATKMMTTGEGGMVVGHDPDLECRVRDLRDYDRPEGRTMRFNYKMTDFQAAMGLVQSERLPSFIHRRRQVAERYHTALDGLDIERPAGMRFKDHTYYRYVVRTTRDIPSAIQRLEQAGVACRRPVTRPIHQLLGLDGCPGADEAYRKALSIPIYPTLTNDEEQTVCQAIREVFSDDE